MGIQIGFSQLGRFITPFLINKMNDAGIYPIIAVSIAFLFLSVFPLIFISEPQINKNKEIEES